MHSIDVAVKEEKLIVKSIGVVPPPAPPVTVICPPDTLKVMPPPLAGDTEDTGRTVPPFRVKAIVACPPWLRNDFNTILVRFSGVLMVLLTFLCPKLTHGST